MGDTSTETLTANIAENEKDPYAYLERDDFTSEKYKIEVRGLPKYYGIGEFKKLLNEKLDLQLCKVKPPRKGNKASGWLYVCFRSEECRQRAISTINGTLWKNSKLTAQVAKPAPDPFVKKKLETASKRFKSDEENQNCSPMERIKLSTTPLWNMPYENQLEFKQKEMRSILIKIGQQMLKESRGLTDWINSQRKLYNGLPCELQNILSANVTEAYRNKCEFTIGRGSERNEIMIGFRLSSYTSGSTAVGPIDDLCHIPQNMKTAVKILETFICESDLEPFNPVDHSGYWRQVAARTTRAGHLMLIVGIHPQDLSGDELEKLRSQLRTFFETGEGAKACVTSLYFQTIDKKGIGGESNDTLYHVSGTEYIEETLLGMKFRVSPQAFFQVNTLGAEVLYKAVIDLAESTTDTALLDVCCGTGTIGLCFSKHCGEVLGIEVIPDAIKDAKENAIKNGVTNCEFFVGKAEDILSPVIQRATRSNITAVVDPPRAGLHQKALLTLRKVKKLSRLVYISCDPRAAMKNLVDLARPSSKQYLGEPLVPVKAIAVDMFPHTKHCELILCLERLSQAMKSNERTS
ncbi:tRNA (uracil-5-)-methyltransferase homolog A [Harpegnathos saltator]|uniref:tRNA (uracil(54)-C(5))-methyltransferase n=1 Tax=Harpegnathos saltator TaxID=610380 RepID=E2CA93_HARSA|nr:tRNA (uracil-5-)-methyltransferase homolog A [Harpegnathos saltator]XP_025159892.1 tRNA (uracil-5-)-methyltransferase homolog A [Harpegnathos saltator]EFN75142.1 HpaII tiny fragments locus 9c protein [Harpegnathos saltator]